MTNFVLVIGESLIDVIGDARHPGGSPMNVAVGLGRLGSAVKLATWFGDDADGQIVRDHLAASHVALVDGSDAAARTSTAQVTFDDTGSASYSFDLDWRVPAGLSAVEAAGNGPLVVHTGSIAAALEPGASDVLAAMTRARAHATTTFDPNMRPQIVGTAESVRAMTEAFFAQADVVKASSEDLVWLYPGLDVMEAARRCAKLGSSLVVVTKGAAGVTALTSGVALDVPAPAVDVVDTVGAGDAFMAGLIHALWDADLLGADRRNALANISHPALHDALAVASKVAGLTLQRPGADPPWSSDLETVQTSTRPKR